VTVTAAYPGIAMPGLALPGSTVVSLEAVPVTNILVKPNGSPDVGLTVYAQLVSSNPWLPDGREVVNWATAVTDSTGLWILNLYPTGGLAAGSYYRIREGASTWTIQVPDGGGNLHDLLYTP